MHLNSIYSASVTTAGMYSYNSSFQTSTVKSNNFNLKIIVKTCNFHFKIICTACILHPVFLSYIFIGKQVLFYYFNLWRYF